MGSADRLVLDGSVALAWLFHDERNPYADAIVAQLPSVTLLVPRLWHLEVMNVLLLGERRGRCTTEDIAKWTSYLSRLTISVDPETEVRAWSETLNLARQHGLSGYDAAYLELALRSGAPLASLDEKLNAAATAAGVGLYNPKN